VRRSKPTVSVPRTRARACCGQRSSSYAINESYQQISRVRSRALKHIVCRVKSESVQTEVEELGTAGNTRFLDTLVGAALSVSFFSVRSIDGLC
jgi:hypothetical protein